MFVFIKSLSASSKNTNLIRFSAICLHLRLQFILHHLSSYIYASPHQTLPTNNIQQRRASLSVFSGPKMRPDWLVETPWKIQRESKLKTHFICSICTKLWSWKTIRRSPVRPVTHPFNVTGSPQQLGPKPFALVPPLDPVILGGSSSGDGFGDEKILCDFASRQSRKFFYVYVYYTPEN